VTGAAKSGPGTAARTAGADAKKQAVVDSPVTSVDEAKVLAEALLRDRAYAFVTGTGTTIGLPDLRPGNHVEIHGVGRTFGGLYYVLKVTHTIGASGYMTEFEVCRTHDAMTGTAEAA
jgi:phage protein D